MLSSHLKKEKASNVFLDNGKIDYNDFLFFLLEIVVKEVLNKTGIYHFYKGYTLEGGNLVSGVYLKKRGSFLRHLRNDRPRHRN